MPQAYLRVLVFTRDSVLVPAQPAPVQLSKAAAGSYEQLRVQLVLPQDGYVTAYVGSQSDVDVFFDDVSVEHRPGLQVQENQYEPWGLSLAGLDYSSPNLLQVNQYQFNGKEQERELGLNWQDFNWRHYDPAMARFFGVDRLASKFVYMTDYQFASNNPASKIELDGLEGVSFNPGYIENLLWTDAGLPYTPNEAESIQMGTDAAKFVAKEVAIQVAIGLTGEALELVYGSYLLSEVIVLGRAGGEAAEVTQGARAVESLSQGSETIGDGIRSVQNLPSAKQEAQNVAGDLRNAGGKLPARTGAAVNRTTGEVFTDVSGHPRPELHPTIGAQAPNPSLKPWPPCNCAETKAVNKALNAGSRLSDLDVHTVVTKSGVTDPPCANCQQTLKGVNFTH